jgi:uncharacterized protein (DUF427 family)
MQFRRPTPDQPAAGQESVWSFPRPAVAQPCGLHLQVVLGGITIAETRRGVRVIETSHPPSYYFPPEDILPGVLLPNPQRSLCEWKGEARYFDVNANGRSLRAAAWSYPRPTAAFTSIRDHVAFYPAGMDACMVDGEAVTPQPGGFYGGWITRHVAGPFKGVPGSQGW